MSTPAEKANLFRALHQRAGAFVIPNPWDAGTARILEALGFEALATTSAGYAFSAGKRDGCVGRDSMLAHVGAIDRASRLPVSADLEIGHGGSAAAVAETFRLAAETGIAGGSIEDSTGDPNDPIFEESVAVERVRAAVEAVRARPFPFTLTARAENYLAGRRDLAGTIRRLQLYQGAGADVLYAPGIVEKDDIAAVVKSVDRPVNVLMGLRGSRLRLAELSELGVKRVSLGSALSRAALGAFVRACREIQSSGTFTFADDAISYQDLSAMF